MDLICATTEKFITKLLWLLISIYTCSSALVSAAENVLSDIAQTSNMKVIEQCVAEVNHYPDDALDTADRLYQTSVCYFCAGCEIEADNGRMFEDNHTNPVVLDDTYITAYKLMQQAAELGSRQASYGLAVLIYAKDLSENKLTKEHIATQAVEIYKDSVDRKEKLTREELDKGAQAVKNKAYTKQHELDFNTEIHVRLLNAAREGHMPAQFALSGIYNRGIGVPPNKVHAYAWAATAVAQNPPFGSERRDNRAINMNSFELSEAESLAEQFMKEYTDIFDRSSITVMR